MRLLGAMMAYSLVKDIPSDNTISDGKISRTGTKNLKLISSVLNKCKKANTVNELVQKSNIWVDSILKDKNLLSELNSNWAERHGVAKDTRHYYVSVRKLHTSKNGLAPVLINRNHPTKLYGEYELIDLFGWANEKDSKTVLYKMARKLEGNASKMYEFYEEVLGYTVEKDDFGYYIVRNNHDFSGNNYVTYFLPI